MFEQVNMKKMQGGGVTTALGLQSSDRWLKPSTLLHTGFVLGLPECDFLAVLCK